MNRVVLLTLGLLLGGCVPPRETVPDPAPIPELRVVGVLPFIDQTAGSSFDAEEFGNILATELAKRGGIRVVRPAQMKSVLEPGEVLRSMEAALRIGRRVHADAVFVCAITDYDPYEPPKIAISVQLLRVASSGGSSQDIDRLLQSGSWARGPLVLSRDKAGHALAAFEDVVDAREGRTRSEIQDYARSQASGDSAFLHEREFLAVQSKFLQFVSTRLIHHALESLLAHGS